MAKRPTVGKTTGPEIAEAAQLLVGQGIKYVSSGSAGNPSTGMDCSATVNWVLGKMCGLKLPLGIKNWQGQNHGPVVINYFTWTGAKTIQGAPMPGDLCIWPGIGPMGHIGIAVSATHMVSALNPSMGIQMTPIHGFGPPGVPVVFRRVKQAAGPGGLQWTGGATGTAAGTAVACNSGNAGSAAAFVGQLVALALLGFAAGLVLQRLQLRRARHDHGPGILPARDHEHRKRRQLVYRIGNMPPVAAHTLRNCLNHVAVARAP